MKLFNSLLGVFGMRHPLPPSVGIAGGTVLLGRAEQDRSRTNRFDDLLSKLNAEAEAGDPA